jgi:DICT domain-containing protein
MDGVRASDPSCRCSLASANRFSESMFLIPTTSPRIVDSVCAAFRNRDDHQLALTHQIRAVVAALGEGLADASILPARAPLAENHRRREILQASPQKYAMWAPTAAYSSRTPSGILSSMSVRS